MEEELDYTTVTFISNEVSVYDKPNNCETTYDVVKTKLHACNSNVVLPENETTAPACAQLHLVAAGLGIVCVILISVVIFLYISLNADILEGERQNIILQRQKEELIRARDRLNWTFGVILEHLDFPVQSYCPQNGSCKPCLDGWIQFQSNCYLFSGGNFSYKWMTWQQSRNECRRSAADLLVIDSQDEQEFISSHTTYYRDEKHGYWIGLIRKGKDRWTWLDKWNLTVSYWRTEASSIESCGLSLPGAEPVASWQNTGCTMKNRWICERRALIRPD